MTNLQKSIKQIFRFAMNAAHPSAVLSNLRSAKFRSWPLLLNFAFVTSNPSCGFLGGGSIGGVVFIRPNLICLDNKQNLIRKRSSLLDYGLLFNIWCASFPCDELKSNNYHDYNDGDDNYQRV